MFARRGLEMDVAVMFVGPPTMDSLHSICCGRSACCDVSSGSTDMGADDDTATETGWAHAAMTDDSTPMVDTLSSNSRNTFGFDSERFEAASVATSSAEWQLPGQVMIFVDWDDTLFPTTWLQGKPAYKDWLDGRVSASDVLNEGDRTALEELDQVARAFVVGASQLGRVCCVTLAQRGWVEKLMEAFLPRLATAWKDFGIQTHYAMEEKVPCRSHVSGSCGPQDPEERSNLRVQMFAKRKELAMAKALRKFYGRQHSWKNVLSIGDGLYERIALQDIGFQHTNRISTRSGAEKTLRVKTVKLAEESSCVQICHTLQLLQAWLPRMALWSSDFDMDLGDDEEPRLPE